MTGRQSGRINANRLGTIENLGWSHNGYGYWYCGDIISKKLGFT
jgi:hypothetical protein